MIILGCFGSTTIFGNTHMDPWKNALWFMIIPHWETYTPLTKTTNSGVWTFIAQVFCWSFFLGGFPLVLASGHLRTKRCRGPLLKQKMSWTSTRILTKYEGFLSKSTNINCNNANWSEEQLLKRYAAMQGGGFDDISLSTNPWRNDPIWVKFFKFMLGGTTTSYPWDPWDIFIFIPTHLK